MTPCTLTYSPTHPLNSMNTIEDTTIEDTHATDRLQAIAAAAIAKHPAAHHIKVRTSYGAYSASLLSFGEPLPPSELAWENDLQPGGRVASEHDDEVTRLLGLAHARLKSVIDRELAAGGPVEVSLKIDSQWAVVIDSQWAVVYV